MKKLLLFMVLLVISFINITSVFGQTQPVDANGVKVIDLSNSDKLSKHFKGDDKKVIRKLVIKGGYRYGWDGHTELEIEKILSKLPNLENIDASGSEMFSEYLQHPRSPLSISTLKVMPTGKSVPGNNWNVFECIEDFCRHNSHVFNLRKNDFPSLKEYVVINAWNGSKFADVDSLSVNIYWDNGMIPVFLPKENAVCFKKMSNQSFQILVGNTKEKRSINPKNNSLEGVICIDDTFLYGLQQDKLVIPSSVRYITHNYNQHFIIGKVNKLEFAPSDAPIKISYSTFSGIKFNQVIFNRPVNFAGHFEDLDSLVFNGSATIQENAWLRDIKEISFNDDAKINGSVLGFRLGTITFKKKAMIMENAFDDVEVIRFEQEPYLKENFAEAKRIYVPVGYKTKMPSTKNKPLVIEPLPEKENLVAKVLKMNKPGSLSSVITLAELQDVDSLTIIGQMYDTDAKVLSNLATRVRYLNLRDCIIMKADRKDGVKHCIVPEHFMSESSTLQEVILPRTAIYIDDGAFYGCENLEKVILPPYLEKISYSVFSSCPSLKELHFPKSMRKLYAKFSECTSLERVIFNGALYYNASLSPDIAPSLKEIRFAPAKHKTYNDNGMDYEETYPYNMTPIKNAVVYIPLELGYFQGYFINCDVYFESPNGLPKDKLFKRLKLENCIIHCPKGSTTAYYSRFGPEHKYVEGVYPAPSVEKKDEFALRYINNQKQLEKRLEATEARKADAERRKADAERRRKYGDNAERCMQCYGTGILNYRIGNTIYAKFCPYCNASGVVKRR